MKTIIALLAVTALTLSACPNPDPAPAPDAVDITADTPSDGAGETGTPDADATGDTPTGDVGPDTPPAPTEQELILGVEETESYTIPGLSAPVHVLRVEASIPHIYASNREDLGTALGFVVARDRWLIMDLQRRLGRGTLAGLLGEFALDNDMEARYQGFTDTTQKVFDTLSPEHLAFLQAFCDGVNAYIAHATAGTLPIPTELQLFMPLLGFENVGDLMEPFSPIDVAAMVAVVMYETNWEGGDPGTENKTLTYEAGGFFDGAPDEALRYAGADQLWNVFAPPFDVPSSAEFGVEIGVNASPEAAAAASGQQAAQGAQYATDTGAKRRPINAGVLQRAQAAIDSIEERLIRDPIEGFGSNAWAVAGFATTDGKALVAGDGHLPLSVPALFYQLGMNDKVFGNGKTHQTGMLLTSLPLMAVGTNGKVAWSQVNPVTDNTDWYREELQLDADGKPTHSYFQGGWEPLAEVTETYDVAEVEALGSVARVEEHVRFEVFDGRRLYSIEGAQLAAIEDAQPGDYVINIMGKLIVPGDEDGDGTITGLSYDWAGFDGAGYIHALDGWGHAENVEEMRVLHTGQIGGGLYTAAADHNGDILYSSYQALPCRSYLQRNADGTFPAGSSPKEVLDGTVYGGFEIPTDGDGLVDEGPGETDPYKCVVPLAETPQAITPDSGYVVTANNEPGPITNDGNVFNDPWYLGGPWSSIRAHSIGTSLADAIAADTMDLDTMKAVQAHRQSRTATMLADGFIGALQSAKDWEATDGILDPWQQRVVDLYVANAAQMDAVFTRMEAWRDAGYQTASGVETFYHSPTPQDVEDSIATMIWNVWMPRGIQRTFNDENMGIVWRWHGSRQQLATLMRMIGNRGPGNAASSAHWNAATEESVYFDDRNTVEVERFEEIAMAALADGLAFLNAAPNADNESGGFGTDDMTQWLWGMRHQTKFESLLADFIGDDPTFGFIVNSFNLDTSIMPLGDDTLIPAGDPRHSLTWYPRPGDNYGVDAANPGFSGTKFTHGSGPVMRMVIGLKDGEVEGHNILPGGQSGIRDSDYYGDQAELWLANETLPMRFYVEDVVAGATHREVFNPE